MILIKLIMPLVLPDGTLIKNIQARLFIRLNVKELLWYILKRIPSIKNFFNNIKKDSFFWHILIPSLVLLTLFISLSPWLAELFATPKNQVFTGINRWSTDYYIYLSYVEQGIRGFLSTKLIFTTQPHSAIYF